MNIGPFPHLTLHRASAGSGKTFALTKIFLRLFLSITKGNGRRLRTLPELQDSLSHILAITFTNKATAEMKQRIISALSNIAGYDPESGEEAPDYFSDFVTEFNTTPELLREHASKGLEILLNNFSDFKVSTIDSFFQSVLRTFAYEVNLKDNYGVEIETEFINYLAIDAMMEQIDQAGNKDKDIEYWFSLLMSEYLQNGQSWNFFQKQDSNGIYSNLKSALRKFELEDYKEAREGLDKVTPQDLRKAFIAIETDVAAKKSKIAEEIRQTALKIVNTAIDAGFSTDDLAVNLKKWCPAILRGVYPESVPKKTGSFLGSKLKSKNKGFEEQNVHLDTLLWQQVEAYINAGSLWKVYRELFPYMALMNFGRHYVADMMNENNAIVLAETNSLLNRIISDDDTPFIYERLGARLNHLLIDEFQDTSGLQWKNLKPLINNALGNGYESLLIGDAKQSIYRFRNANPEIIMKTVPEDFPNPSVKGETREENTNYRSDERIVQFNNLVFSQLPSILDDESDFQDPDFFKNLYSTAIQQTKNGKGRGYVRIEYNPSADDNTDEDGNTVTDSYSRIGELIQSLLAKGYRQRDIAILVRTKDQAAKAIDALIDYNSKRQPDIPAINFVSEESLSIASSRSVDTVINCLRNIASAASLQPGAIRHSSCGSADNSAPQYIDWQKISTELSFFVSTHPELSPDVQIEQFFTSSEHTDLLGATLSEMHTTALPALIETLAKTFVFEPLRHKEAPFLAAFQDAVLDYTASHISDIGSFLNWWDVRGHKISISSPADTEAVQVMTVHKSKGIEFKCVIIPECDWGTKPAGLSKERQEWKWVEPQMELPEGVILPPQIPVLLNRSLEETPHRKDYNEYRRAVLMDSLNALYVAFTRAVNELYIFLPPKKKPAKKKSKEEEEDKALMERLGHMIPPLILDMEGEVSYCNNNNSPLLPPEDSFTTDGDRIIEFGVPLSSDLIKGIHDKEELKHKKEQIEVSTISDFPINTDLHFLKYSEGSSSKMSTSSLTNPEEKPNDNKEEEDEEEKDPRSEGNLLHDAMAMIITEEDIDKSLLYLKSVGKIPYSEMPKYRARLKAALDSVSDRGWFDPSLKVINERPILTQGKKQNRADRIIVDPLTDKAVIIDYKFGEKALNKKDDGSLTIPPKHIRQVSDYIKFLEQTGLYTEVSGYLWYVPYGFIHQVKV